MQGLLKTTTRKLYKSSGIIFFFFFDWNCQNELMHQNASVLMLSVDLMLSWNSLLILMPVSLVFQFLLASLRHGCKLLRYAWHVVVQCLLISNSQTNSSFGTILFNDLVEINYSLNCKGELKPMLVKWKQCDICHNFKIDKL